jgi:transcriptional regulator with XRE-family HTH domain
MEVHVGKLIEWRLDEMGMTKAEFGRRINTSRQNVNSLLRKPSLDTAYLQKISEALHYDFFKHFLEQPQAKSVDVGTVHLGGDVASIKLLIELPRDRQDQLLDIILGKGRMELINQLFHTS